MNSFSHEIRAVSLFLLIFALFVTKAIDCLVIEIHMVNFFLLFFALVALLKVARLEINIFLLMYFCVLAVSAVNGFLIDDVSTSLYGRPVITAYSSPVQPVVGFLYSARYLLIFAIVIGTGFFIPEKSFNGLLSVIIVFLTVNCIFIFIEYASPQVHDFVKEASNYPENFSFVYRGFSLLFNAYDACVSMIILSALAFYRYRNTKLFRYIFLCLLAFLATILLGTRMGYLGIVLFWFFVIMFSKYSLVPKMTVIAVTIAVLGGAMFALALFIEDVAKILISFQTLADDVGSMQLHLLVFIESLRLIFEYPFGVGIGKTNFAAIGNSSFFDPESFMLSLALDAGIISIILFIAYHFSLYRSLKRAGYDANYNWAISSLVSSLILLSVINIQIFNSVLVSTLVPVLIGVYHNISMSKLR